MADSAQDVPYTDQRIKEVSAGMWQDFYDEGRPFSRVSVYKNDFHSWIADEWTVTEVDAGGGDTSQILLDVRNGVLQLLSAQNEDDGCQIQLGGTADGEATGESWAPANGSNLWFECRFRMNDVTQQDIFVGLHINDTTIIASRGSDFIGFRTDDGDALLDAEATAGSAATSSEVGIATLVDNTFITVGFKVTGTERIDFYVNGTLEATQTTNIPTGLMKLSLAQLTGEAVANSLEIDYVCVAQDRG